MTIVSSALPAARKRNLVGGADLGKERGAVAKRLAAAILEVLAGARTPTEAAVAVGLSLPRYYQVEATALRGLLAACEPKPKGRVAGVGQELTKLRRENQRVQRELTRYQSLVRAGQRAVGLAPPVPAPHTKTGKKPRRPRVARALSVAARLQQDVDPKTGPPVGSEVV